MICANPWFASAAFCATRLLYHIRFDLSRGFAKVFSTFFRGFQPLACPFSFSAEVFDIISRSLVFVKRFLKDFFNLFRDILSSVPSAFASLIGSWIISHPLAFVKRVFKDFFNLFRDTLSRCSSIRCIHPAVFLTRSRAPLVDSPCLVDSSHIIALLFRFVKGVFQSFFTLAGLDVWYKFWFQLLCIIASFWCGVVDQGEK